MLLADVPADLKRTARENWFTELGFTPKLGQRLVCDALDTGKRHLGYFTPPQDGKSFFIAKLAGSFLLFPEVKIWIIAPTYEDGSKEFLYIWDDLAQAGLLRTAGTKHKDVGGGDMRIELKNKAWVQVVTAKEKENLRREQLDVVIYAEASKLDANLHDQYVYSRVERRRGLTFYPTTHKGHGWVYDDVRCPSLPVLDRTFTWGPWENHPSLIEEIRAGRIPAAGPFPKVRKIAGGDPNPDYDPEAWSCQVSYVPEFGDVLHRGEFTEEQIEKARKRLLPPMFAEQFGGEASSYAGLVYPFDRRVHKHPRFPIPIHWTHVVGYDHGAGGGSDPTAILVGSYSPQGVLYWWGEIYDQSTSTIQARGSRLKVLLNGRRPSAIMAGRDSKQVITELRQVGLSALCPQDWSVEARIIRTAELIGLKRWVILDGCCPNLEREIGGYEWDEKHPGKPRDGNDHCLEAAGYAVLAPVKLPDAAADQPGETPEQRGERFRRERLWKGYRAEERRMEVSEQARKYDRMLERHTVEDYVAR